MKQVYQCYQCEHCFYYEDADGFIDRVHPRCPICGSYSEPLTDPDDEDEISEESDYTDEDENAVENDCETDLDL